MTGVKQHPLHTAASVAVYLGLAGTGKTEKLLEGVVQLLTQGVPAKDIRVFAATASACDLLRTRLVNQTETDGAQVRVSTISALEKELLARPEALMAFGRTSRTLLDFEETFLLEDMKTTGTHPRRLQEMIRFFERSWANLEPMDDEWFYGPEEQHVYQMLCQQLTYRKAYLESEIARRAWELASTSAENETSFCIPHVFIDDFQLLSRASQSLACLLASDSLTIAVNPMRTAPALECFPYPEGVQELLENNEQVRVHQLSKGYHAARISHALNQFCADETLNTKLAILPDHANEGDFDVITFEQPHDELEGVANKIQEMIAAGYAPSSIAVAGTNASWVRYLHAVLSQHNIQTKRILTLKGEKNFAQPEMCPLARTFTLLKLVADPADAVALRSWCGYGDYLANSRLFELLSTTNQHFTLHDTSAIEALLQGTGSAQTLEQQRAFANRTVPSSSSTNTADVTQELIRQEAQRVLNALQTARYFVETLSAQRGCTLFESAWYLVANGGAIPAVIKAFVQALQENESASTIVENIQTLSLEPRFIGEGVTLGMCEDLCGLTFETVFVAGLTNGLLPKRSYFDPTQIERDKRPGLLAQDQRRLYAALASAHSALYLSTFKEVDLPTAEKLQLKFERVRLKNKRRICETRPSETIRTITGVYFHE